MKMTVAAILALATSVAVGAPSASAQPLASVASATPVSAAAGWVVWSQHATTTWRLMARNRGITRQLPIMGRRVPFDADVGTDRRGRAVATFSRCDSEPLAAHGPGEAWWTADGCHIRVVDLASGRE